MSRRPGSALSHARRTFSPRICSARRIELSVSLPLASYTSEPKRSCSRAISSGSVACCELLDHLVHLRQLLVGDPLRGERRRRWQQQLAHLDHLVEILRLDQLHREHHARQQLARGEARDVGAVATAHVEHVDLRQRAHRLAQRPTRHAEPIGQLLFGRQPFAGCQFARADHRPDAVDRLRGDAHHKPPMSDANCAAASRARCSLTNPGFPTARSARDRRRVSDGSSHVQRVPQHQTSDVSGLLWHGDLAAPRPAAAPAPRRPQPRGARRRAVHPPRRSCRDVRRDPTTHQPADPGPARPRRRPRDAPRRAVEEPARGAHQPHGVARQRLRR